MRHERAQLLRHERAQLLRHAWCGSPPLVGRGWGWGSPWFASALTLVVHQSTTPLPNPPPQGGREHTELAARPVTGTQVASAHIASVRIASARMAPEVRREQRHRVDRGRAFARGLAAPALRVARVAGRPARLLRVRRLHLARRHGDCRRRIGRIGAVRWTGPRRARDPRRRSRVLAQPARGERCRARLPQRPWPAVHGGHHAGDGAHRRRPQRAGRGQGGRCRLSALRRGCARSCRPARIRACSARRSLWRRSRSGAAGAARSQAGRSRHARRRRNRHPRVARLRAGQARRRHRLRPTAPHQRRRRCARPGCCSRAAWCAGITGCACRRTTPATRP